MYINNIDELLERVENSKRIYIYGAGKVGLLTYYLLLNNSISIMAFIVTQRKDNNAKLLNKPVLEYSSVSFKDEDIIIIAALGQYQNQMVTYSQKIKKRIIITDTFFDKYIGIYIKDICNVQERIQEEKETIYRKSVSERKIYKDSFSNVKEKELFSLLKGLDKDSKEVLIRCIHRISTLNSCEDDELDIFLDEEKEELRKVYRDINNNTIQLKDGIWCYRGYLLPINAFSPEIFYYKLGLNYVKNKEYCRQKDIIDVGGYIGDSALVLSEITDKMVHVFEPIKKNCDLIQRTMELNQLENIVVNNIVTSNIEGITKFAIGEHEFNSSIKKIGNRIYDDQVEITTTTIDNYVHTQGLNIGLIKVHAEGAEQQVIQGALQIIKEQKPIIIVEINHTESDFYDIKPMLEELDLGYRFRIYKPANGFVCLGTKLIAEVD